MSDYMDLVKQEAGASIEDHHATFLEADDEFGGKSPKANLLKWIDEQGVLAARVKDVSNGWGLKEYNWVQANTRNKKSQKGGDAAGRAFASFLQDIRHEIKKRTKR